MSIDMAGGMKGGKYKGAICGESRWACSGRTSSTSNSISTTSVSAAAAWASGRRHDRHERAYRHGRGAAELRTVLCARKLRPMHALPRRLGVDAEDSRSHRRRWGPAKDLDMLLELEKTMGIMPARRSAAWRMARPGRRGRLSTSFTMSSRRGVRKSPGDGAADGEAREIERRDADGVEYAMQWLRPVCSGSSRAVNSEGYRFLLRKFGVGPASLRRAIADGGTSYDLSFFAGQRSRQALCQSNARRGDCRFPCRQQVQLAWISGAALKRGGINTRTRALSISS